MCLLRMHRFVEMDNLQAILLSRYQIMASKEAWNLMSIIVNLTRSVPTDENIVSQSNTPPVDGEPVKEQLECFRSGDTFSSEVTGEHFFSFNKSIGVFGVHCFS